MKTSTAFVLGVAVLSGCLSGCGTPQAALDQANNGAALTMSLQAELQKFRSVQLDVARARVESIRRQEVALATYELDSAFDERILRLAGKTEALSLYSTLKDLSDSRIKDEHALKTRISELDESFSKLLSPLPDSTEKLTATGKTLAILGEELSVKDRIEMVSTFAQTIKNTISDNQKKIDATAAATPVAPSQPNASNPKTK